jgi:hypothetical protein
LIPRASARSLRAAAAIALLSLAAAPAGAEQLARLNVSSFTMQADTAQPRLEVPFHIIYSIHVAQRVVALQNVILPPFGPLEIQGDEQHITSGTDGTDYRESVTVVSHQTGHISIPAAWMDAIDARDGKPKRFLATTPAGKDTLELDVSGGSLEPISIDGGAALAHMALRALSFVGGLCVIAVLAALVLARRRPHVERPPQAQAPVEVLSEPHPSPELTLVSILANLRSDPTREGSLAARARVWDSIGAPDGATLDDVLDRPAAQEPRLRAVLRAAERAAFTHDADLSAAIAALIAALEAYVA